MRSLSTTAILLLSLLFLAAKFGDARKGPTAADYWKSMMKGKPMPTAIEEVLVHDHDGETSVSKQKEKKMLDPSQINMAHFKRDFETTRNDLIYHSQNNMGHTTPIHDHDGETFVSKQKEKKMFDPSQINMAHFKRDFETTRNDLIYHSQNDMGHTTVIHDHDGETSVSKQKEKKMLDLSQINMAHFKRDFETTRNDLIYHSQNNMGHISPN